MYFASFFLFITVSAIPNDRVHVVFPAVETSRSGEKTLKLRAFDRDIELNLQPAGEILAKNFGIMNENHRLFHLVDVKNLQSKLYRNSANGAALLIDEDGPVTIEGNLNAKLRIAPHESRGMDEEGRIAHQIEEEENEEKSYLRDDMMLVDEIQVENTKRIDRDGKCIVIEILSVTDRDFTKRFSTYDDLTKYVSRTYLGVENIIERLELGIKVRLLGIQAFTNETEPPFIEDSVIPNHQFYLNYTKLISSMEDYYCEHAYGLAKDADIIMLTTVRLLAEWDGSKINTNIAGAARYSSVCNQCYKVGVSMHFSYFTDRIEVIAHETAHLIGVPHDGSGPVTVAPNENPGAHNCSSYEGYFMGLRWGENANSFSECSKKCAAYLLSLPKADCLYEECQNDDNITSLFEI
uniref:Metalloserrulase 7 n=1 Tax=Tityus serrulatus TaxID=6887 RepID=A0A076LAV7_TITSE|nr:metalloserrulase 7 [Tityus serrulatus]